MSTGPVRAALDRCGAVVVRALVGVLHVYQRNISPAFPPTCRFYPSCSSYAVDALRAHGVVRGIGLTVWRLLRCHPWHPGGVDPVPPPRGTRARPPSPVAADTCAAEDHLEEQAPC